VLLLLRSESTLSRPRSGARPPSVWSGGNISFRNALGGLGQRLPTAASAVFRCSSSSSIRAEIARFTHFGQIGPGTLSARRRRRRRAWLGRVQPGARPPSVWSGGNISFRNALGGLGQRRSRSRLHAPEPRVDGMPTTRERRRCCCCCDRSRQRARRVGPAPSHSGQCCLYCGGDVSAGARSRSQARLHAPEPRVDGMPTTRERRRCCCCCDRSRLFLVQRARRVGPAPSHGG
jgi:hypothetical protein